MPLGKNPETQALLIAGHLVMDLGSDCVVTPVLDNQWSFHTKNESVGSYLGLHYTVLLKKCNITN